MPFRFHPPGTRKGNKYWIIRGGIPGEREREISTGETDEGAARKFAALLEARLYEQSGAAAPGIPERGFRAVALKRMQAYPPAPQDEKDILALIEHFGDRDVASITQGDIFIAAHKILAGTSNANKNRHVVAPAGTILHFAAKEGLRDWVRYDKLEHTGPAPRAIPIPKANAFIEGTSYLRKPERRAQVRALLVLLFQHGPRISEAIALRWRDDIDMDGRRWRKTILKKRGKEKIFKWKPMTDDLYFALANLPGDRIGYVFPWRTRWGVYRALSTIQRNTGMQGVTPHVGRHTFAQTLRNLGKDRAAMKEMLDWTDEKMADRYSLVSEEEQTEILEDVGEAFRGIPLKRLKRNAG